MANSVHILNDDFLCDCGNNSHAEGAYPSDSDGNDMPDDTAGVFCCDRCGVVFRIPEPNGLNLAQDNYVYSGPAEIVGQRRP